MANKRIRKKWASRLTKDARRIAKRFKIARQEVGAVGECAVPGRWELAGTIVESQIRSDGVREITDFRIESISFVPLEQALHPSWHMILSQTQQSSV